ncbi:hypothetical protein JCM17960_28440 [Magnetospira thiophila]
MAIAVLVLGAFPAQAGDGSLLPHLTKGKGTQCVEPTNVMRRNHMDYLKHQRDETMRQGIRGEKYSLAECVECHATPDPRPEVKAETLYGFCQQCHSYAAVTIDCFGCHTPVRGEGGHSALQDETWKGFELAHKPRQEEKAQ